jgi:type II secretory pathway pseudopilin PulG
MNTDRAVTAIVSILATAAAGYFGVAKPAVEQASTANAGLELAQQLLAEKETTLAKREAQIERREAKIDKLKEKLEACQ